jgi:protein SCO1
MRQAQIGLDEGSPAASYFLRGDATAIDALTKALGFRSVYDRAHDQFAHPSAAFAIAPTAASCAPSPALPSIP